MNSPDRFDAALARLAADARNTAPPASLEAALVREFDRTHRARRLRPLFALAAAAAVAVLWWGVPELKPRPQPAQTIATSLTPPAAPWTSLTIAPSVAPPPAPLRPAPATPIAEPEHPFTPIPFVAPLDPYERADVVRMDLPVSALIAAGVPVDAADTGASVEADVLIGQDGRARAVRLVSISSPDQRRVE